MYRMVLPLVAACFVIVYQVFIYSVLYFRAENRAKAIEESLPNALQLMAANINSGMTPFLAMKASSSWIRLLRAHLAQSLFLARCLRWLSA